MNNVQTGHLGTIKNLQTEIKTLMQNRGAAEQDESARPSFLNREVTPFSQPDQNLKNLKSENTKLKANENTMATTLQCVSNTIKTVLGFTSTVLMKSTLEGVLGMAMVVLNDRKNKSEVQIVNREARGLNGVKREVKDEVDDENGSGSGSRASKKVRLEVIELD